MTKMETLKENLARMVEKRDNLNLAIEQLEQKIQRKELHETQVSLSSTKKLSKESSVPAETEQEEGDPSPQPTS